MLRQEGLCPAYAPVLLLKPILVNGGYSDPGLAIALRCFSAFFGAFVVLLR